MSCVFLPRPAGRWAAALVCCFIFLPVSQTGWSQRGGGRAPNAGTRSSQQPYTIPVLVRRVVLDVVVTDGHGNAIRGLKKKDFRVFEDKKEQDVRSFDEVDFDAPKDPVVPKLPPLPPDTYVNVATTQERGPLYVIVYDAVHMEGANPMSSTGATDQIVARKQLADFLANKPAGTRFALFLLGKDFRLLQGFTTDPNKLLEAFDLHRKDGYIPNMFLGGENFGAADPDLPFTVMRFLGHYLEGLPGRKNLIWLSTQFPAFVPMFAMQAAQQGAPAVGSSTPGGVEGAQMSPGSGSAMQAQGFSGSAPLTLGESWDQKIMMEAIDALNAAQVSVYPVDVGGGKPELDGIDTIADHIADATGGRAYYNTNDIAGAIEKATINGASYYEISYMPSDTREDQKMRQIRIDLDKKGDVLEYRRYYFAEDPNAPLTNEEKRDVVAVADQVVAHQQGDSMFAYMKHGAPIDHDLVFRAQFHAGPAKMATPEQMADLVDQPAYFVVRKSHAPVKLPAPVPLQKYTIDYLVLDKGAAGGQGQMLEFAAGAYDNMGKLLNGISQNAVRNAAGGAGGQPIFRAEQTLEVPTDAEWLRVAVRDVNTDRIGTMEIHLPLGQESGQQRAAREPGAGSREPGAGSREPGAGSREPGAGSREPGAGSREPGAG
ncbi:MAG TPA: VWA domain-containing protein, partial [Acidobacteriaceae bacterium]|nr:VWA domain-containing protein [Acidobacteriaceae bacterium]